MKKATRILIYAVSLIAILSAGSLFFIEYKIAELNRSEIAVIAHAGGEIDGNIYTDSLDALNHSYLQGIRIFELDISKTKDGHFVAVHDWDTWAHQVGYRGELPPLLSVFKQYKILGKYTPLDFGDINHWFLSHPDAVLVTDKIDNPSAIVKLFIDSNRLKMELFSEGSIKEAGKSLNGGMANYYTLKKISKTTFEKFFFISSVQFLKDNNIRYVVTGRPTSQADRLRLKLLRVSGIKVYMYFFGSNNEINAQVLEYRDYLDGVYYDKAPAR
ncbi:hypothetical protein [Leminorella grimontii]|uniref:hypothetical protein n=1 Tax=Leminorella grimontii TaxID=82981 RepID=UPI0021C31938|nr:hypothetical protein [Leminorella grimontii]